ncbi:uncharacterized protein LOC110460583 isoform X3 [Mizuhopecten yessoensis]|uniref:Tudor domain-containing protein 1 n=1 Tax=Mizuhopecten yessoensis TaxID=6573 RepID=A0A210Q286_MIZYE|nr:uncharacterized protein LOC110460583 isoform X3 [Mizuhopecten yessoensis]XP_021369244.1 uncharacterized protein LOC110460583 isoform X3 [Mizuhopecten yessoensis]OWF42832.1 Tudor domain-containing protein 1 [Mizuhopecten yessoensis]
MDQQCEDCEQRAPNLKRCGGCYQVFYCSRKCQKRNWKSKHRDACKKFQATHVTTISTSSDQISSIDLSKLALNDMNNNAMSKYKPVKDMRKALNEAKKVFPNYDILDDFRKISETFGSRRILVAYMSKEHPYPFRHCIYIQDKTNKEMMVAFYLDHDDPTPHFRWQEIIPGNYLCVKNPYIHFFMDGQAGFRIDEPEVITVLSF